MLMQNIVKFNYKYNARFILKQKIANIINYYNLPEILKISSCFYLSDIVDYNDPSIYNIFYFMRVFFGSRSYFYGFREEKSFTKTTLKFSVNFIFKRTDLYNALSFFIFDIRLVLDADFLKFGYYSNIFDVYYYIVKDLNIFSEKKTNLGLFFLKNFFYFKLYIKPANSVNSKLLLNLLKI